MVLSWGEQGGGDPVVVPNHEGDGHGLAQRASEPEYDGREYPPPSVWEDGMTRHFPVGGPETDRSFLLANGDGGDGYPD